jgi:hypothetical protein
VSRITARFYVAEMTNRRAPAGSANATIVLTPAYANGANKEWATATPSGKIELQVSNPLAVEQFTEWMNAGQDLHLTFEPAGAAVLAESAD